MKFRRYAILPLAAFALTSTSAHAATLAIVNPSFEDDDAPDNSFLSVAAGWTLVGNPTGTQDFNDGQSPQPTDGEQHGFASFQPASLSQLTTHAISAGETYTLTVDVGQLTNFSGSEATIYLFGSTAGFGTPLANVNGTAQQAGIAPASGAYLLDQTVTYTALASGDPFEGQQIGIALVNSVGTQTLFDNVRLEAVGVPEPSSLALLGLGGLALLRRKRH